MIVMSSTYDMWKCPCQQTKSHGYRYLEKEGLETWELGKTWGIRFKTINQWIVPVNYFGGMFIFYYAFRDSQKAPVTLN